MDVSIESATERPMELVSAAAGTCYGREGASASRVRNCYRSGHMSVFEHASVTFRVSGISRACSHQLVRHRLASYSQQSQRYCRIDAKGDDWYVIPPSFVEGEASEAASVLNQMRFRRQMHAAADAYLEAIANGIKPEDARFMLPEACKTEIVVTMNLRELYHFLDLRQGNGAQWEIRELACEIERALLGWDEQWRDLMELRREDE